MSLGRLAMDVPSTWEDRSMYTFIAPRTKADKGLTVADDGFRTSVVVTVGPRGEARALETFAEEVAAEAKNNFGELKVAVESGPDISGAESRKVRYRIIEPGGVLPLAQIQFLTIADETEWTFTFTTAAVNEKAMEKDMVQMIRSVRIGKQEH